MRSLLVALAFVSLASSAFAGAGKDNPFGGRRVLVIGIDGCRADAIRKLTENGQAPHLRSLVANGTATWTAFAGGILGQETEQETSSGPGWTTILTGVWRDRHGVTNNRFRFHRIAQSPHWMRRIKDVAPRSWLGSLCDWPEIHDYIVGASRSGETEFLDYAYLPVIKDPTGKHVDYVKCDALIAEKAAEQLKDGNPDALFVYFGNVDETGHAVAHPDGRFSADNEHYCAALAQIDERIGQVLAALNTRPKRAEEDWLILATTDHGGKVKSHGGQSEEERTIWMIASGGAFPKGKVVDGQVPQTAVAPTVFKHLGIPAQEAWGWPEPFAAK